MYPHSRSARGRTGRSASWDGGGGLSPARTNGPDGGSGRSMMRPSRDTGTAAASFCLSRRGCGLRRRAAEGTSNALGPSCEAEAAAGAGRRPSATWTVPTPHQLFRRHAIRVRLPAAPRDLCCEPSGDSRQGDGGCALRRRRTLPAPRADRHSGFRVPGVLCVVIAGLDPAIQSFRARQSSPSARGMTLPKECRMAGSGPAVTEKEGRSEPKRLNVDPS